MQENNPVERNRMRAGHRRAYKKQRSIQVSDVFRDQVVVMFIGNFLVDSPEVRGRVGLSPNGFQACNCFLQPEG